MSHNNTIDKLVASSSDAIQDLKSLVETTVVVDVRWYQTRFFWYMLAHRVSGVLIIALSVSLPLIISQNFPRKDLLISVIGVLIAFLSGLNSFMRWGEIWKANIRAMVELKNHLSGWELRMLEAKHNPDPKEGIKLAVEATKELFETLRAIDNRNTEEYFQNVSFPDRRA